MGRNAFRWKARVIQRLKKVMNMSSLKYGVLGLVLAALAMPAGAAAPRDPSKFFFEQSLGELPEDLAEAKKAGKRGVLIFFELDECPFCHRMKTTVLNQPAVQDYFRERFLILVMDIESTSDVTDFQGQATNEQAFFRKITRNRDATPVFAFFDLDGKLVVRYTGATSGVDEFMWLGEYASEGHYKSQTFTKFKRAKRQSSRAR